MRRQVLVVGLGRFGVSVSETLTQIGYEVLAIDRREMPVQDMASRVTHTIQADATNETVLKELGVRNFDIAIVAIGSGIENSVLATILLKKLGIPRVIARANNDLHGDILERIGADMVVSPEKEMGSRVARGAIMPGVSGYLDLAPAYGIARFMAPPNMTGQSLSDIGIGRKGKWEVAALVILRGQEIIVNPAPLEIIQSEDVLVLAGNDENLERMFNELQETENPE